MIDFLILYFFNLILDYPMQDEFIKKYKSQNNYVLYVHCAIWGIGLFFILAILGLDSVWKLFFLIIGHFIIDYWKCRQLYKKWNWSDNFAYIIDQLLHIIQLIICIIC